MKHTDTNLCASVPELYKKLFILRNKINFLKINLVCIHVTMGAGTFVTPDDEIVPENSKVMWEFTIVKDNFYNTKN